nr:envelope glycoprotein, DNA packaging protein UL32 [Macronycteris gammaherpesvirus 1]
MNYLPWRKETIFKHSHAIQQLLQFSFQPGSPENALNCPILSNTLKSLLECSPCKICQLIFCLAKEQPTNVEFYEDYACLCFFSLYAPQSWTSTLMLAADFLELVTKHFPEYIKNNLLFQPGNILGIDIQLHFLIQKCFRPINQENVLDISNLHILKNEFLKGALTGSISNLFCFKTIWHSLLINCNSDQGSCCNFTHQNLKKHNLMPTISPTIQNIFSDTTQNYKQELLSLFLEIWSQSELLNPKHQELVTRCGDFGFLYPESGDHCQGPCMLSQAMQLKKHNNTSSICLLCECLASHPQASRGLELFKEEILNSVENNVKLTDRIAFLIEDSDSLSYVSDPLLKNSIKGCSPQEIHKHFFCDPMCSINTASTYPDILFKVPNLKTFQKFKSSLAVGLNLNQNSLLDCEVLSTLTVIFKSIQLCKVGKTTFLEIVKELNSLLKKHNLATIHTFHTAKIYC